MSERHLHAVPGERLTWDDILWRIDFWNGVEVDELSIQRAVRRRRSRDRHRARHERLGPEAQVQQPAQVDGRGTRSSGVDLVSSRVICDVCTDCGHVLPVAELFRCGRGSGDEWLEIWLCIDCLYAVNPHMQRDLIEAAYA